MLSEASLHSELQLSGSHILDCTHVQSAAEAINYQNQGNLITEKDKNKVQEYFSSLPSVSFL